MALNAPAIPGLTQSDGMAPGAMSPMHMVAMMMGMKPGQSDSTTEKMSQIVQLLREVSKEDPRMAALASDALTLLLEGPSQGQPGPQGSPVAPGQAGSMLPMGGPGQGA